MEPAELSRQLRKPTGDNGRKVASQLNESNKSLYDLVFEIASLTKVEHLLEIGFGNGKHFPRFFEENPDLTITGIDFSRDMCIEARSANEKLIADEKLYIHCSDSSSLKVPDQSQDLVIALNVIYFWEEPEIHLEEIKRALKPGGRLILGYRPKSSVEHFDFTKQNFILYTPEELHMLVAEYGFEVVEHEIMDRDTVIFDDEEILIVDACLVGRRPYS